MSYVDGVAAAVPQAYRERFVEHAEWAGARRRLEKDSPDTRMQPVANTMPLDGKRMIFDGFEVVLEI